MNGSHSLARRAKTAAVLTLAAAGLLVLTGCGGDDESAAETRRPAALLQSAGPVTSHTCNTNADYVSTSKSTFDPVSSGHYQVRVWFYDANGYAFYKKNWVDKGSSAGGPISHTTSLTSAKTRRALVTWMDVNATDRYSQRWATCT